MADWKAEPETGHEEMKRSNWLQRANPLAQYCQLLVSAQQVLPGLRLDCLQGAVLEEATGEVGKML